MADTDDLLARLRATRDDYSAEVTWGRFLLDAYCGTGGFSGRIKPPTVSQLGWVAEVYGMSGSPSTSLGGMQESGSYLDQYGREDAGKYAKRCEIAHFSNYVETIFDLLVSYALKRPATVEDLPDDVKAWRENVTVYGASWNVVLRECIARRAGMLGWCPVLIDQIPRQHGLSVEQVKAAGIRNEPFITPLTPANVLDWYVDDVGVLQWVKVKLTYVRHDNPLTPAVRVDVFKVYSRTTVTTWEAIDDNVTAKGEQPHPFGCVPMISFQHKPHLEERLRGVSMIGDAAIASRRLFNLDSELDEHIRSNVFAMLQVPVPPGKEAPSELLAGAGMALPVPSDATQKYEYLAPPASVAETLETRIANTVREIFRRARVQFKQASGQTQSGVSKQWDFEETNRLLADFAAHLASAECEVYKIIARVMGASPEQINKIRVLPVTSFSVEDLAAEIENATEALALNLGATANKLIKGRVAGRMLENVSSEDATKIEGELEAEANAPPPEAKPPVDQNQQVPVPPPAKAA